MLPFVSFLCSLPAQIPRQISFAFKSPNVLNAELIGWLQLKFHMEKGKWLFVVEDNRKLSLTAELLVRAPNPCNAVVGMSSTDKQEEVRLAADRCVAYMKDCQLMPGVRFS